MNEIVCECGHGIEEHYADWDANCCHSCACLLSNNAVEARYWARRMMTERDALSAKLEIAKEALEKYANDKFLGPWIAKEALKKLEER